VAVPTSIVYRFPLYVNKRLLRKEHFVLICCVVICIAVYELGDSNRKIDNHNLKILKTFISKTFSH